MLGADLASKRKRKRSDYGFRLDYRTRWSDNDVYGHMNNSVYAFLIDSIVNAYLIQRCGMDPATSAQVGLVVSSYCDYFSSAAYPAVVDLGLRVVKMGTSSVVYEVGVFEQGQEEVKAVGGFTHVFVENESRRSTRQGLEPKVKLELEKLLGRDTAKL